MNDIVKNIESWFKFLADLFREPEIIDALAAIEKRKPGTLANFEGMFTEGEPVEKNVISDTPVVADGIEATTGGLVETQQSGKSSIMEKVKAVKVHLVNAGQQRSTVIPAKDKLNINKTSEESKEESNITVVPPEPPQVEEPVIQSLPGVDVTNEKNVNNKSDAGDTLTASDLVNEATNVNQQEVQEQGGKTFVKSANDVATRV